MKYQLRFIAIGATLRRARSQINIRSKPLLLLLLSIGAILNIFLHIPTRFGVNDLGIDARWFVELENQFRLGHLLGRDVHFTYGPLAQVLAWLASFVRANDSALYGYGIGNAVFEIVAVIALVLSLAMIKQIREGGTLFIFVMYVVLNSVLFLRPLIVLLGTVLLNRTIEAPLQRRRTISVLIGLLWFAGQLVTVELMVYSILSAVGLLSLCSALTLSSFRHWKLHSQLLPARAYLEIMVISLGTLVVCNIGIEFFNRMSSPTYGNFDYIYFSFLLIRDYSYTMGRNWSIDVVGSCILLAVMIFTAVTVYMHISRADIDRFYLFSGLLITSIISLKSALIRSDAPHIFQAMGPFLFLLLLSIHFLEKRPLLRYTGYALMALLVAISVWYSPFVGYQFKTTTLETFDLGYQWRKVYKTEVDLRSIVPKPFEDAVDHSKKLLNFPYDSLIAIAMGQPSLAPVLQTYAAFNEDMQKRYVSELDKYRDDTEIIYALDKVVAYQIGDVQSITRSPLIFKYILEHFKLKTNQVFRDGYLVLAARQEPVPMQTTALPYEAQTNGNGTNIVLREPASCGLLQLDVTLHYPMTAVLGRPNPLMLQVYHGEELLAENNLVAIENGRTFSTFIYIGTPERFGEVFRDAPSSDFDVTFDRISVSPANHDLLGVNPDLATISNLRCVQQNP